ncbi:MAG: plasma-membrane proton-efflux P-type ATPase, partial [Alphaproteobacteria bacterium]|nr:plasma-membrane proton-efflux P-type ATPase [Alphaproteobacteria bacterium]
MDQLATSAQTNNPRWPGLTEAEAQRRLKQYGPNAIPEPRRHPLLTLLSKFWGPIPWMLETTIVIQVLLGKAAEAAVIAALLAANA